MRHSLAVLTLLALVVVSGFTLPRPWTRLLLATEYARAGVAVRSVIVSGRSWTYLEGGAGELVVLLHGFGGNKENWIHFAGALTNDHRVIALDLAGFGGTPAFDGDSFSIDAQTERVHEVLTALHLGPMHLAGNSMGGQIAANLAARWPADVRSLMLIEPHGLSATEVTPFEAQIRAGSVPLIVHDAGEYEAFLELVFVERPFLPWPIHSTLQSDMIAHAKLWERAWREVRPDATTLERILHRVNTQTLILWGDSDRVFPRSVIPALKRGLAQHKTVVLTHCGHAAMMEQPSETALHYRRFLSELTPP